ncbi:MAG TPA: hypothetical protein VNZ26_04740, partial [Vicinamibacterales bacterium]|nr:hypothetical protein [Vicinamibacterales bacterium]
MPAVSARQKLTLACFLALLHGLFFIWYQRPDWSSEWSDQEGYSRLGEVLAATGTFTPAPEGASRPEGRLFVPEVIRTPAYPAFVAVIYKAFGVRHVFVALAQTGLFVLMCPLVFGMARRVTSDQVAGNAAIATALFAPIPYFGALIMTEVWTTFLFTASMWMLLKGFYDCRPGTFAALGALLALTALSRPAFALFPVVVAVLGTLVFRALGIGPRVSLRRWAVMIGAFTCLMIPWLGYNYVELGQLTLSPAGGVGRGTWEGSWQAIWPGRLGAELTRLAETVPDRTELDRRVEDVATREGSPDGPMLQYVHQWSDLHRIWADPTDPYDRAMARIAADRAYLRTGLENIRGETSAHIARRVLRGLFILWAGEIPVRYSDINRLPPWTIRAVWGIQVLLLAAA